jgi:hypothetical protein
MKVAIFQSREEVIILPVKGRSRSVESIDGYKQWFGDPDDRDIRDFDVTLCHIGAGSGIHISTVIRTDWLDHEVDITDWFHSDD